MARIALFLNTRCDIGVARCCYWRWWCWCWIQIWFEILLLLLLLLFVFKYKFSKLNVLKTKKNTELNHAVVFVVAFVVVVCIVCSCLVTEYESNCIEDGMDTDLRKPIQVGYEHQNNNNNKNAKHRQNIQNILASI